MFGRRHSHPRKAKAGRSAAFSGRLFALWLLSILPTGTSAFAQSQPPQGKKDQEEQSKPGDRQDKQPAAKPLPQFLPDARYDYQGEATFILQQLFRFHSPYAGTNSLRSRNETETTDTVTLYLGACLVKNLEVYVNPEMAWGNGIGRGQGLAGYTNGDDIGQSSLRPDPYLARSFVRWRISMPGFSGKGGGQVPETQVGRSPNLIEGNIPDHRLVISVGKMAIADFFDINAYANNPRAQFMNNAFGNNLAYDFAQETRGYDLGAVVVWVNPTWAVRFGTFAMPTSAGGPDLAYNWSNDHSEQLEGEFHPRLLRGKNASPMIVRMLAFRNVAGMGNYRDAIAARQGGLVPDITAVRHSGAVKYGFGLNFEQGLADGGATGLFGRWGWNDGATENFSYAEADRSLSFGGQLSGAHWGRKNDLVGLAWEQSDLSGAHRYYLAAGGLGLALGDGTLRYGPERSVETYYSYQLSKPLSISLDYQYIDNPGYNHDRGPASVVSARVHLTF